MNQNKDKFDNSDESWRYEEESKNKHLTTLDVFDALPTHIQRNHKLLKAFCRWYLDNWQPKEKDRMDVKTIARRLHQKYPHMKSPELSSHPEIAAIKKDGNYSQKTIEKWIKQAVKIPAGRPPKK